MSGTNIVTSQRYTPEPGPWAEAIRAYEEAGFDEVYLGQVGGRLDEAFEFFATHVLPAVNHPV